MDRIHAEVELLFDAVAGDAPPRHNEFSTCRVCGALVFAESKQAHYDFHRSQGDLAASS